MQTKQPYQTDPESYEEIDDNGYVGDNQVYRPSASEYGDGGEASTYQEISEEAPLFQTETYPILEERPPGDFMVKSIILQTPGDNDIYVFIGNDMTNVRYAWRQGFGIELVYGFKNRVSDAVFSKQGTSTKGSIRKAIASKVYTTTFKRVSSAEKARYTLLISTAKARARQTGGRVYFSPGGNIAWKGFDVDDIPVERRDFQKKRIEARSLDTDTFVKPALLKDSAASKSSNHASQAQVATLIDISTPAIVHKRASYDSVVQKLSMDTGGLSRQSNSTAIDAISKFEEVLEIFQAVQANISDTIFPILEEMTSKTNSSLIFQAAQSIWIDLVSPGEIAVGPFQQGLNCLDTIVNLHAKELNITLSDPAFQPYLEVGTILVDIYEDAWNRSYTAINQNGLLKQLNTLTGYLSVSPNTTIAPPSFLQVQNNTYDDAFFTDYNRIKDLGQLLL